jgi:hypothetical protein
MRTRFQLAAALSLLAAVPAFGQLPGYSPYGGSREAVAPSTSSSTSTAPVAPSLAAPSAPACTPTECSDLERRGPRSWFATEFLLWYVQGSPTPPLVVANQPGTPQGSVGLGSAPALVLFGGERLNGHAQPGVRFSAGHWLNCDQTCGIEGNFFWLFESDDQFFISSDGSSILSRPFFNSQLGTPDAQLVSFPGVVTGSVLVSSDLDLFGAEVNALHNLCGSCGSRVDLFAGYRFLALDESLTIVEGLTSTAAGGAIPPGTRFGVADFLRTENRFHGGQVGMSATLQRGRLYLNARSALAVGNTHSEAEVFGRTRITLPGQPSTNLQGGLLALASNSGTFSTDNFSLVPSAGLRVGFAVTNWLWFTAGYEIFYWTDVWRVGEQIDVVVNPAFIPPLTATPPGRPAFPRRESDVFVQGGTFGIELRW